MSLCPWRVPTAEADGTLPLHQPVRDLASIFSVGHIHRAKQSPDELRPELRTVVKEYHCRAESGAQRILGYELTLPLGIKQVPVRRELVGTCQRRIEIERRRSRVGDIDENMLSFRLPVAMLPLIPFALLHDLREDQRILDGIEGLPFIEEIIICVSAAAE